MQSILKRRPSPSIVVAIVAVVVAMAGTAVAGVATISKISGKTVKKSSLPGNRIKKDTVTGQQVKESTLGTVPNATNAANATNAGNATTADRATNVISALINSNNTVISSVPAGAVSMETPQPGTGLYGVIFNRPIAGCTWFPTVGSDDFIATNGDVGAVPRAGNPNALFVARLNTSNALTNADFSIQLVC
jgi:hypothetical protein